MKLGVGKQESAVFAALSPYRARDIGGFSDRALTHPSISFCPPGKGPVGSRFVTLWRRTTTAPVKEGIDGGVSPR